MEAKHSLESAGQTLYPSAVLWLGLFSSLVMIIITVIYCFKVLRHTKAVITELHHPIRLNFFPAFSIGLLLLSVVWENITPYRLVYGVRVRSFRLA